MQTFVRKEYTLDNADEQESFLAHVLSLCRLTPLSTFEYHCTKDWLLKPRRVRDSYWTYVLEGSGRCWLKDPSNMFTINPGHLILFPENVLHALTPDLDTEMLIINVHFLLHTYNSIDLLTVLRFEGVFDDDPEKSLMTSSRTLTEEFGRKRTGWQLKARYEIWNLLIDLFRQHRSAHQLSKQPQNLAKNFVRLQPVFELVENHFSDPSLSVSQLASHISLSEVSLRKLFHRVSDCTPVHFIQQQRINKACVQLKEGDMPIKRIAADCGFRDLAFFYRIFKKFINKTPAEYRRQPVL